MIWKLPIRIERGKIISDEALAMQLELEEFQLQESRENYKKILDKTERVDREIKPDK